MKQSGPYKVENEKTHEIIEACKKAIDSWYAYFSNNINTFKRDRQFYFGDQWESQVLFDYSQAKKPTLVIDQITPFIKKMIGEQRRGEIYPNFTPKSVDVPQEKIDMLHYLILNELYNSDAKEQFSRSYETMLTGGFSALKVYTDYKNDMSFEQEIYIQNIEDPLSVFWDPTASKPNFSNGNFCGCYQLMGVKEFESKYPGVNYQLGTSFMPANSPYYIPSINNENVILVNFFRREMKSKTLIQLSNGINFKKECLLEESEELKQNYYQSYEDQGIPIDRIPPLFESNRRKTSLCMIKSYKLTASEIIEESEWPSDRLPYVYVDGDSILLDGRLLVRSFIAAARDAQRLYNFAVSEVSQILRTSRRAPLMMTADQILGHENMYTNISNNYAALLYNTDPSAPPPFQLQNQEVSQSFFMTAQNARDDITRVLGMLDPITGNMPDGTSGQAIDRTITQQNLVVVNYVQHLERAIEEVGKIILSLIPNVYDSERSIIYQDKFGNKKNITLNKYEEGKMTNDINELVELVDDFRVEGTANYAIQNQQSLEFLLKLISINPQSCLPLFADLLCKQIDIPLASEIEKRSLYLVPDYVQQGQPAPPPAPNPEIQLQQQQLQLKQQELGVKATHIQNQSQQDKMSAILDHIQNQLNFEKTKMDNITKLMTEQMKMNAEIHKALIDSKKS